MEATGLRRGHAGLHGGVVTIDGTMLVGEISNLAREEGSLKALFRRQRRPLRLAQHRTYRAACSGHEVGPVKATDVLLAVPLAEMNAACDRIAAAIANQSWEYAPQRLTVIGYSFDDAASGSRVVLSYPIEP